MEIGTNSPLNPHAASPAHIAIRRQRRRFMMAAYFRSEHSPLRRIPGSGR